VVAAAVAASVVVMGPPSKQRLQRLDERRIADLGRIQVAIQAYRAAHDALPADLSVLAKVPGTRLPIADPESGEAYGYEIAGKSDYRLCARFATDTAESIEVQQTWPPGGWEHAAGRQCFERHGDAPGN
jgi:hypothetical protein